MDHLTHNVRRMQWENIIRRCTSRPAGTTAKQWLADNGINEKSYYYWLRKTRKEVYEQMDLPAVSPDNAVTFVDVKLSDPTGYSAEPFIPSPSPILDLRAAAVICTKTASIAVSNDISGELLAVIIREAVHA